MRRARMTMLACAVLLASVKSVTALEADAEVVKRVRAAIVTVEARDGAGKVLGVSTGFFVTADGKLVTDGVPLHGAATVEAVRFDGTRYPVESVLAEDVESRLVLLKALVPGGALPFLVPGKEIPKDHPVFIVAGPAAKEDSVPLGKVTENRGILFFTKSVEITVPIAAAADGAPVLNQYGELGGVALARTVEGRTVTAVLPLERLTKLELGTAQALAQWSRKFGTDWDRTADGWCAAGLMFLWKAQFANALPYFTHARAVEPARADVRLYCGYCEYKMRRNSSAREDLEKGAELAPDNFDVWFTIGSLHMVNTRDWQAAVDAFRKAHELRPDDPHSLVNLSNSLMRLDKGEEAQAAAQAAVQQHPELPQAHQALARIQRQLGHVEEAAACLRRVIDLEPYELTNYMELADMLSRGGDWKGAEEVMYRAVETMPDNAEAYHALARTYVGLKRGQEALDSLEKALELVPDDTGVRYDLAVQYFQQNRHEEAIVQFRKILERHPRDYGSHYYLGCTYMEMERWEDSLREFEAAEGIDPDNGVAGFVSWSKAEILSRLDRTRESAKAYARSAQFRYKGAGRKLGEQLLELGCVATAARAFKAEAERNPDDEESRAAQADAEEKVQQIRQEVPGLVASLGRAPDDSQTRAKLARDYVALGELVLARRQGLTLRAQDKDAAKQVLDLVNWLAGLPNFDLAPRNE